jgi:hypothetical protein
MSLDMSNWKEFRFGDLISDIYKAKAINKDDLTIATDSDNTIRYITRTGENNGCELLADIRDIDSKMIEKGNAISIGDTTATCFYQAEDFITGDHMVVVRADSWLNPYTALYIVTILTNEQYKYSYGRAYLMDRIKDTMIKLPVDSDDNPDWQFMEDYIKSLRHKPLITKNKSGQVPDLNVQTWKEFRVGDLFHCSNGTMYDNLTIEPEDNSVEYYTSSEMNNGFEGYVTDYNEKDVIRVPSLTVGSRGNDAVTFYHEGPYIANQNLTVLLPKKSCSKYAMLFFATVLFQEKPKYSYGRLMSKEKTRDSIVKLPVDSDGNPDWQFMEDYIKALPYGDRLEG